jgi:hypothetical protein
MKLDKLKKVTLDKITEYCYYNQVSQTSEIQWALLNKVDKDHYKELHLQVKCREYFGDAVVCGHLDIDTPTIYGFSLKDKRIALNETLLSVCLPVNKQQPFLKHFKLLRRFERAAGWKITRVYSTQHSDKLVIVGSKKWVSSPLLISLYTAIIRSFTYDTPCDTWDEHIKELSTYFGNDAYTFNSISTSDVDISLLLNNSNRIFKENPLTGLNDATLIANKQHISDDYTNVPLAWKIGPAYTWNVSINHANHGIVTFCDNIKLYKQTPAIDEGWLKRRIGGSWLQNYLEIANELSQSATVQEPAVETLAA